MTEFKEGRIIKIERITDSVNSYIIQADKDSSYFKPGQFITLDLPIHEKKNKRLRSYSIASRPNRDGIIELVIVKLEGGLGTTYLFEQAKAGTQLLFRGPLGHFVEPEGSDPLILVCTGTGIAPFRSMILDRVHNDKQDREIHLIFGTRTQKDILFYEELKSLSDRHSWLHYHPVLSREAWSGATGYVHSLYTEILKDIPSAEIMLCGWRVMIDEARERLAQLNIENSKVHFELYG